MKKIILMQWIAIVIFCIAVCGGCTKDNVISQPSSNISHTSKKKSLGKAPNFADIYTDIQKFGSMTGAILPIDAEARVYLSGAASIELIVDSIGMILPKQLPEGEYTVDIAPANYYYGSYTISNVFVYADSVTNLGTITLEYANYGGGGGCEIGWGRLKTR